MVAFLKLRVVFITLLLGLFGGALSLLLKIDELQSYYPALAALIALCVSLLISFLIKGKWTIVFRNRIKKVAVILFSLFIVAALVHTYFFINSVFKYENFNGDISYYIKGSVYTAAALKCKKQHPEITSDAAMMTTCFESPEAKTEAWTEESINNNVFRLIISYCAVILFFVGTVSLLTEILASKYAPKKPVLKHDLIE
jgi:hypothetical protein